MVPLLCNECTSTTRGVVFDSFFEGDWWRAASDMGSLRLRIWADRPAVLTVLDCFDDFANRNFLYSASESAQGVEAERIFGYDAGLSDRISGSTLEEPAKSPN